MPHAGLALAFTAVPHAGLTLALTLVSSHLGHQVFVDHLDAVEPSHDDLDAVRELLVEFGDQHASVVRLVRSSVGCVPGRFGGFCHLLGSGGQPGR